MRREVIDLLTILRLKYYTDQQHKLGVAAFNERHSDAALSAIYPETHLTFEGNVVNKQAMNFYHRHGVKTIEQGLEVQSEFKDKQVMITHHCLKYTFGMCSREPKSTTKPEFKEPFYLASNNKRYRLAFDCANCVMKIIY
jgi:putative protease